MKIFKIRILNYLGYTILIILYPGAGKALQMRASIPVSVYVVPTCGTNEKSDNTANKNNCSPNRPKIKEVHKKASEIDWPTSKPPSISIITNN
jgi:hypothetical protein